MITSQLHKASDPRINTTPRPLIDEDHLASIIRSRDEKNIELHSAVQHPYKDKMQFLNAAVLRPAVFPLLDGEVKL
jgi:hypothetical protein